ncbi:MAG: glycosyltransferase family 39 protein [Planctomycetes bacterium]|nr:glycosyltransferase family 39 protein [Planctomycetota bacterium]
MSQPTDISSAAVAQEHTPLGGAGAPWMRCLLVGSVLTCAAALFTHYRPIPPFVESDYCYQLIAADRLFAGHGPTATQPVAPKQAWTWRGDWEFLTKWPVGYSAVVCAVRTLAGLSTLEACRWISAAACAFAVVGWFVWTRRAAPRGTTGLLAAAVAAGSAVPVSHLVNPSTDALLVAALPFVMLAVAEAVRHSQGETSSRRSTTWLLGAGLASGAIFWIRYASVFVPTAIGVFLVVMWARRRIRVVQVLAFALGAAVPIAALLAVNQSYGAAAGLQSQLNLGADVGFDVSPRLLAAAWWRVCDLGFYEYREAAHWFLAVFPAGLLLFMATHRRGRAGVRRGFGRPETGLSFAMFATCLLMIVAATALFGSKFRYVGLDRYYLPVRPLYFALFVTPLAALSARATRGVACAALLVAGVWIVNQEWARTHERWYASARPASPYGAWSRCFEPGAGELFTWLRARSRPDLIVISNFHEYVALETGIPALPVPPDMATLTNWLHDIRRARGAPYVRVLFALDPDNRWRDYWILPPAEIVRSFGLATAADAPPELQGYLFDVQPPPDGLGRAPGVGER